MIDKKMMKILAVIPARMSATRFPGKPMEKILGIPMIGHCYLRTKLSSLVDEVFVATCDKEIIDYILSIDGDAIMTSDKHERATERTAEALINIEKNKGMKFDFIVMVQGDEPLVYPKMIDDSLKPLIEENKKVSNLMQRLNKRADIENKNNVKVIINSKNRAIYMSREPIPSNKIFKEEINYFRQLGLIAFTRESLIKFTDLKMSRTEIIESVDMNRLIENNVPIHMVETMFDVDAVDHKEDLQRVEKKMKKDKIFKKYNE